MSAAKSRLTLATPGTNRSWLPPGSSGPDQVQGWRAAWLPKLPLVPSFHLLPAKFWNLFHIMNMSGVCAPVYMCLRSMTVSTVTYQCLQSHVCIRVWCKKWNQSCMSQLLQLFQATLTIRITVWFVTMSSPPLESSQPKNCGNIRKVNWNSFSISSIQLPSNGRNLYLITLINLARARVCNLHSRADKSKSSS